MYLWRPDQKKRATPNAAGMTLIELLVAVSVAMILMLALYYIYAVSTKTFKTQDETMGAMDQARFGLEQIRRDIGKAAFLATPNSIADAMVCPKPAEDLKGIVFERIGAVGNPGFNKNIQPNGVTIFGAFWGSDVYITRSVLGNIVTLQNAGDGAPYPSTEDEFNRIFAAGRFLRLVNAEQFEGYYRIDSASFATGEIQLEQPVGVATPPNYCGVQGFGVGLDANVVGHIRYRQITDPDDATGAKVDLIREEIDSTDVTLQTPVANSAVRIAEFVVDLQFYDFIVDTDRTGRAPFTAAFPLISDVLDAGTQKLDNTTAARPQDLRFVTIKLTTRTVHEDEMVRMVERPALFAPIETYEVEPTMLGSARTVSLASRVGIKSFAVRNVK